MAEFNTLTQQAFQNIINTINKVKSSIPTGGGMNFGSGGVSSSSTPDFSYDSPYFGNLKGFAEGGSVTKGDDGDLLVDQVQELVIVS